MKNKMRNQRMSRNGVVEFIKASKGRFFTVTFIKKNGEERTINCNTKNNSINSLGRILVYSMSDKSYKQVDIRTISKLSINGSTFKVR